MINLKKKISLLKHKEPQLQQGQDPPSEHGEDDTESEEEEGAAHKLWKQWAAESLGPLPSANPEYTLSRKNAHLENLEKKCAALAQRAQKRLDTSAAIRQGWGGGRAAAVDLDGWQDAEGDDLILRNGVQPGGFPRVAAWTTHEQRKQAVYNIVRGEGMQERKGGPGSGLDGSRGDAGLAQTVHQPRSHALLASMMAAAKTGRRGSADGVQQQRRSSDGAEEVGRGGIHWGGHSPSEKKGTARASAKRLFAGGAALDSQLMGILTKHERPRPLSAIAGNMPKRALNRPLGGAADGGAQRHRCQSAGRVQPRHQSARQAEAAAQHEAQMSAMQDRLEDVRGQLEDALNTVQSHSELEVQLRDTVDMLRARLHAQGAREQEQQRRLQQHTQLEPLFDRLAENWAFKSPEDVVARLEFLEDEKLSSLDELIRTQEEVTSLQKALADAMKRVELTHSTLTTSHISATARLSEANNSLEAEVQELEGVNRRLVDRQEALLTLQGAVIDLWSLCQDDPSFKQKPADSKEGQGSNDGQAEGGGLSKANPGDPLNILALVKEFLVAKSPQLASRQYLELQKVANHVWMQHFQHKEGLYGRVAETFEALSNLADIMAAKIRVIQDQLKNSVQGNKHLEEALSRLTVQKRALQASLARRDSLVRHMSGVPKRERPHSASAYHAMASRDEVTNWDSNFRKPFNTRRPIGSHTSTSPAPKPPRARPSSAHPHSSTSPPSPYAVYQTASFNQGSHTPSRSSFSGSVQDGQRPHRPVSAPVRRQPHAQQGYPPLPPQLFQHPRASGMMSGYQGPPAPRIADRPAGAHWDVLAASPKIPPASSRPSSAGSLFNTPYATKSGPHKAHPSSGPPVCSSGTNSVATGTAHHPIPAASPTHLTSSARALQDSTTSPALGAAYGSLSGGTGGAKDFRGGPSGLPLSLPLHANFPHTSDSSSPAAAEVLQGPHNLPSGSAHDRGDGGGGGGGASSEASPAQNQEQGFSAGPAGSSTHGTHTKNGNGAAPAESESCAPNDAAAGASSSQAAAGAITSAPLSQAAAAAELVRQQQRRERELGHELNQPRWHRRQQLLQHPHHHQQKQQQQKDGGQSAHPDQHLAWDGTQPQSHGANSNLLDKPALVTAGSASVVAQESRTHAPKWVAPSRSAIEASFLTRLERAASTKG